jgi:choice-of-anchor A domain-containing protein
MTIVLPRLRALARAASLVLLLSPLAAQATPLTASDIMANYNLVAAHNVSTNSDIEGSAVVGGNLNGATVFNNSARLPANPVINIYGNVAGNLNVNNGGAVHYGTKTGNINLNGGSTAMQGAFTHALAEFLNPLNQLSTDLKGLTANSTISTGSSKLNFNAAPDANGLAVFALTAAQLQAALTNNSVQFNYNGANTIVVNVSGSFSQPSSANWNAPALTNVIFNFHDATSLTVGNWEGAILAPYASLSNPSGAIEGFVYVDTFLGNGEIHNFGFTGRLPGPPGQAPEPASALLLVAALIGLLAARRAMRGRGVVWAR